MKRAALVLAALLALASCGGGGGGSQPVTGPITPAPPLRADLLFGYYGGCVTDVVEEAPHVNFYWATGWCSSSGTWFIDMAAELTAAKGAGIRNVVLALWPNMVWGPNAQAEATFQFQRLAAAGALQGFDTIAIYPQDEPDVNGYADADVTAAATAMRVAMKGIPELAAAKLAVIYNCRTTSPPGIASFDWVGCDDYGSGCKAASAIEGFGLTDAQRAMVVPGGADPWRQDPACFLSYAEGHIKVVAIVPFIWQTAAGHTGIRENGVRPLYCQAGRTVLAPGTPQSGC